MNTAPREPSISPSWRRVSSAIALVAALAMALRPPVLMAQTPTVEVPALPPATDSSVSSTPLADPADQAKPTAKPKKKVVHRHTATDYVSDDLNRLETQKAQQIAQQVQGQASGSTAATAAPTSSPVAAPTAAQVGIGGPAWTEGSAGKAGATVPATPVNASPASSPAAAAAVPSNMPGSEPPAVPAIPPRAPIVTASLTPTTSTQAAPAPATLPPTPLAAASPTPAAPAPVAAPPAPIATLSPKPVASPVPSPQTPPTPAVPVPPAAPPAPVAMASLTPTTPAPSASPALPSPQRQAQATPPVPVPPPALPPTQSPVVDAPSRAFAQSQLVPTQQPTLSLEINKGTALRLPGPASTVFVAAPDIADVQVKSPGMIYVFAKKAGDTVLYAVDAQDHVLLNTIVHVTSPVSRMKAALDAQHPGNAVNFDNQAEMIVLSGTVRSAVIAEDARRLALAHVNNDPRKVINNIRVDAPNQVQLRVKIAEVDRNSLKRVGINWMNISNLALFGIVPTVSAGFAVQTVQSTGGAASGAVALQTSGGLNGFIDLLATQNKATVLAEPNLIAMSGETASFLAGGEIPVITPQAGLTGSTISVQYQQYGVSLAFTPTIVGDRINLKVAPEVSQLSSNGAISVPLTATSTVTVPALSTRKASTTVELGSGQSFAIAGLLQQTGEQDVTKIPWIGDIPILGTLFKSDAYQRQETELVIIVTPYFVEPTSEPLRTPFTGLVPPTDVDRLLLQRLNHPTPPTTVPAPPSPYPGSPQASLPAAGFKLN